MQVVISLYDEQGIRGMEPIKFKRQTEVLDIFPNDAGKPFGKSKKKCQAKINFHFASGGQGLFKVT